MNFFEVFIYFSYWMHALTLAKEKGNEEKFNQALAAGATRYLTAYEYEELIKFAAEHAGVELPK